MEIKVENQPLVDEKSNEASVANVKVPAGPLEITVTDGIVVECNDIVSSTQEEKVTTIRQYIRSKILRMFNVSEVNKTMVQNGKMYFNNNRTSMKLPKVKITENGNFAESLEQYYERAKPYIKVWLQQSLQNSGITVEQVEKIG